MFVDGYVYPFARMRWATLAARSVHSFQHRESASRRQIPPLSSADEYWLAGNRRDIKRTSELISGSGESIMETLGLDVALGPRPSSLSA